ncbi:MAG: GWxTD domain-containing protein [Flavobacteriales bacterium]|nr:GWxTD domain-containing protein [Flavobacteriales bacterium]
MTFSSLPCCLLLLPFGLNAQSHATLDAIIATKRFHVPGEGVQLDLHISVLGSTAVWKANAAGASQAHIEALTIIERDTAIVDFRKSDVLGPERTDTLAGDFLVEEHFMLPPGEYTMSVELSDLNGPEENRTSWKGPLVIPELSKGISFSDAMLTAGTRDDGHGSRVPAPYTGTYYPTEVGSLGFYTEIYGADAFFGRDSLFTVNYQIEAYESHLVKGQFKGVQRVKAGPVVALSKEFPIAGLPSGNYLVAVEALDRDGQVLARQEQFIQRNNPLRYDLNALASVEVANTFVDAFADADTLADHVASLRPIATPLERRIVDERLKDKDLLLMKRFFYTFWVNRDGYDPERAWRKYHEQVVLANRMYGCRNMRGYESDQGITFLKYGLPSSVVDGSNDNKQLPYLIWHYYKAGRYSDKRFVFWQQNTGIGCWELLHSEIPGERNNPHWQSMLSAPLGNASQIQGTRVLSIEGQRVEDNFLRPH